jgi:hypothetical protein
MIYVVEIPRVSIHSHPHPPGDKSTGGSRPVDSLPVNGELGEKDSQALRDGNSSGLPGERGLGTIRPLAWFAFDLEDFGRKVRAAKAAEGRTVFEALTPRGQLEEAGLDPESPEARAVRPETFALAEQYGWDTPLYRADYLLEPGVWQAEPVSELDAYAAAVAEGREACRVYLSDQAAETALYRDPLYQGREGFYAHMALREQLIAMEAISDEM